MKYEDEVGLLVTGILGVLTIIFTVSFWCYSDSDVKEESKNEKTNTVEIPKYNPKVLAHIGSFTKVEIEKHWYLVEDKSRSMTHMASCPCWNKGNK